MGDRPNMLGYRCDAALRVTTGHPLDFPICASLIFVMTRRQPP